LAALLVLEEFFLDRASEWQLIAGKAKTYLKAAGIQVKKEMDALMLLI